MKVSICYIAGSAQKKQIGLVASMRTLPLACEWSALEKGEDFANPALQLRLSVAEVELGQYTAEDIALRSLKYYPATGSLRRARTPWLLERNPRQKLPEAKDEVA